MQLCHRIVARSAAAILGILAFVHPLIGASAQTTPESAASSGPTPVVIQTMPPMPAHGGTWTPDPTLQSKLDKPFQAGDYTINPPLGYKEIERDSPDGAGKVWNWTIAPRANGSQPSITVAVANAPKGEESKYKVADILGSFVDGIRQNRARWTATSADISPSGSMDNVPFQRLYYNVIDDTKGYTSRGFVYVAEPTVGTFVIINGEDAEPAADTTFPIMEDSALTLRLKGAPTPPGVPK